MEKKSFAYSFALSEHEWIKQRFTLISIWQKKCFIVFENNGTSLISHTIRPQGDSTGEVSDSGASVVRHGLNADKAFMQVHYLKVTGFVFPLTKNIDVSYFLS